MAETMTSEVVGKVALPAGAASAAAPRRGYTQVASKPFHSIEPQIQSLVRTVLRLYEDAPFSTPAAQKLTEGHFVYNACWDTPFGFARGTDRMRALAKLLALPFSRVVATPRIATVSMINESLGRIDVEGVLEFYPRLRPWPLSLLLPAALPVHVSWCVIANGDDDDRVMSVTETLHNLPKPPYALRALAATAISTAALTVANF